jgi:hypothetical protein
MRTFVQHPIRTAISRRRFGLGALGTTLVAATPAGAEEQERVRQQQLHWTFAPVPVSGGTPGLSSMGAYHIFGGPGEEPSSISNFKGSVGIAFIDGTVKRTNVKTGDQQSLPFTDTDMRFMTGTFRGMDGQEHPGTFGFV